MAKTNVTYSTRHQNSLLLCYTHLNVADSPPSVLYSDGFWLGGSHVCAFSIAIDS